MKKYINYSIIVVIFIALIGLIMFFEIPRLSYKYNDDLNGYSVTNVYGNNKEYIIPETYKGKPVVSIANKAFEKQSRLENIKISKNIIIIEQNAFYNCTSLKDITIPKNVIRIGVNAFLGCTKLKSVTFEEQSRLEVLEGSVFFDCRNLESVILPINIKYEIGDYCFYNTNIKELVLSKNVTLYNNSLIGVNKEYIVYK